MSTGKELEFRLRGGESWRNPYDSYRWLREEDPVHRVEHPIYGNFWIYSRFEDVFEAVCNTDTYSSAQGLTPDKDAMKAFEGNAAPIVMMDPPEHTDFRRLVSHLMTPRRVAKFESEIRRYINKKIEIILDQKEVDIISNLFKPLPSFVVSHYLGVPLEDRELFDRWTNDIVAGNAKGDLGNQTSTFELFEYSAKLFEKRKSNPGEDLISVLAASGEDVVSAMWAVGFVFTMITGGNDTTTGLLGGMVELVNEHPKQREILVSNPTLIADSIDEFLRLTSPVQNLARTTTKDVRKRGANIPKGAKVLMLYASANRDQKEFGLTAEELIVNRKPKRILSLGYGPHHCLGAALARTMGRAALESLLEQCPNFSVDVGKGSFSPGSFVRRYEYLPFVANP